MKRLELLKKTGIYFTAAAITAALTISTPVMSTFASDHVASNTDINEDDPGTGGTDSGSGSTDGDSGSGKTGENSGSEKTGENSGSDNTSENIPENTDGTDQNQQPQTGNTNAPAAETPQPGVIPETPVSAPKKNTSNTDRNKPIEERKTELDPNENPTGYDQTLAHNGTNEQLIASQNIVSGLSIIRDDFRFYTVKKDLAFSSYKQSVHEDMKNGSRSVGSLEENDALYVLSEEKDGWLYVESANVRGFVKASRIVRGEEADLILKDLQDKLSALAALSGDNSTEKAESVLKFATETVPAGENKAFAYKRCTTKSTLIDKEYAIAGNETYILENASDNSREIGRLASGNLCYIIMQVSDQWVYVESGNARGFTRISDLMTGKSAAKIVEDTGEESLATAEQLITPSENKALYFSLNSVRDGVAYSNARTEIVKIAAECIGNPYVWGGNSLTYGCDCSGFVKTLYSMFGYNLPRVADDQSRFGTQIPIDEAAPGDLIFFASNGYVYHVALYAGDGTTIEAYSEDRGIIATDIGNRDAVWATRVIED